MFGLGLSWVLVGAFVGLGEGLSCLAWAFRGFGGVCFGGVAILSVQSIHPHSVQNARSPLHFKGAKGTSCG